MEVGQYTSLHLELMNLFQVEGDMEGGICEWFILDFMKEERVHQKFTEPGQLADGEMTWQMGSLWSFHLAAILIIFSSLEKYKCRY